MSFQGLDLPLREKTGGRWKQHWVCRANLTFIRIKVNISIQNLYGRYACNVSW